MKNERDHKKTHGTNQRKKKEILADEIVVRNCKITLLADEIVRSGYEKELDLFRINWHCHLEFLWSGGWVFSLDLALYPGLNECLVTLDKDGLFFSEKFVRREQNTLG